MLTRTIILVLITILSTSPVYAIDGTELLKQVDQNLQPASYETYRTLTNIEPDGTKKEYLLYSVVKNQEKMIVLVVEPANEKGRAVLRLGDNIWLYTPNAKKSLSTTGQQSMVGGVFNNSDIMRREFSEEYQVVKVEDEADHYLFSLKAKYNSVAYDKLKMSVDKKALVPISIQAFAETGLLVKTFQYKEIKDFGDGVTRPSVVETESPLQKSYKSVMLYSRITKRQFEDEIFNMDYLPHLDELR